MKPRVAKLGRGMAMVVFSLVISSPLWAQVADARVSGAVRDPAGAIVPNAKISAKNLTTGQSMETETNASGIYNLENLTPGDYEISVAAEGFSSKVVRITLGAGAKQTMDVALSAQAQGDGQTGTPPNNLPNAPSSGTTAPSLSDLGFPASQTKGSAEEQARLDKRSHMLKVHQRLGLITAAPLVATVVTGTFAGGKRPSSGSRDLHAALGSATAGLYFTTAYFSIFAPKVPGTPTRGPIRLHKALAWIHGPGMILTPILGAMAFSQKSNGEKVHGIASAHGPVAIVTAGAYGAALLSVSLKF
jgi:carboxypeptidase family protein